MAKFEEYTVHCRGRPLLGHWLALCDQEATETDILVPPEDFHRRAGGVCPQCAATKAWKHLEKEFLGKERL